RGRGRKLKNGESPGCSRQRIALADVPLPSEVVADRMHRTNQQTGYSCLSPVTERGTSKMRYLALFNALMSSVTAASDVLISPWKNLVTTSSYAAATAGG